MYALPRPSSYIAKSKIVFPRPRTCSANNNMSLFSTPVFLAGDFSVSSGVQERIASRRIGRFLPRCFRRGCFLPGWSYRPQNVRASPPNAQGSRQKPRRFPNSTRKQCGAFWNFALTGAPQRARAGRNCNGHRGDGPKRAPSSTETSPSCVVKNSYPLTVPKCSAKLNSDADFSSPKNT